MFIPLIIYVLFRLTTYIPLLQKEELGIDQSVQCLTTDWTTGVPSPADEKDFSSSICVQTSSGSIQPPIQWVAGGPFPGVKRGRGVTLTTYLI
jgi:hypothetical protein